MPPDTKRRLFRASHPGKGRTAGFEYADGTVVNTAPILYYINGWPLSDAYRRLLQDGYRVEEITDLLPGTQKGAEDATT